MQVPAEWARCPVGEGWHRVVGSQMGDGPLESVQRPICVSAKAPGSGVLWGAQHSFIHSFAQHRLLCPAAGCALCPGETERQCSRAGGATDTGGWSPLMGGVAEHTVGGTMEMGPKALPEGQPRFSRRAWGQSTFHPRWTQSHSPEAFLPRLSPQTRGRSQSSLLAECHCPHLGSIDTRTG